MKFLHLGDLHLGKTVLEISMLEEQRHMLRAIAHTAVERGVDAVVIAGDVYDRSVPPAEAVEVFDEFLVSLHEADVAVLAISGNHDSPDRLEFGSRLFARRRVYIAGRYTGSVQKVTLSDAFGAVHFYLLPFIKPATVRAVLGEAAETTEQAVRLVLRDVSLPPEERHVLVAHQFVTAGGQTPETSDSETMYIGGLDNVDSSCFDGFDYVALGHLHRAQRIGRDSIRYAGSPLKYSLSEIGTVKSMPLVTLGEKGEVACELIPLTPLRDWRRLRGSLDELLMEGRIHPSICDDYIYAILTEDAVLDLAERLRVVYPNLVRAVTEAQLKEFGELPDYDPLAEKSELQLFEEFFYHMHEHPMDDEQRRLLSGIIDRLKGEDKP